MKLRHILITIIGALLTIFMILGIVPNTVDSNNEPYWFLAFLTPIYGVLTGIAGIVMTIMALDLSDEL